MANLRDQRAWQSTDAKIEKKGLRDWERAERSADSEGEDSLGELIGDLGSNEKAATVLRQFWLICLPPKSYGDSRRFKSGFYRMIAFVWRLAPELIEGCETDKDVAVRIGISPVAFFKHLKAVDGVLGRDGTAVPKSGR